MLFSSCTNEQVIDDIKPQNTMQDISKDQRDIYKETFGKAFAAALEESQELRQLVKDEALKMFNKDYDVLYYTIKDHELSGQKSVRELLLKYLENEEQLLEIERELPLLTIFVPTLPENSFSAQLWDISEEIPAVGITTSKTNDVKIVEANGKEYMLGSDLIPAFPVVVIKENERIVANAPNSRSRATGKSFTAGNSEFHFLADCFDGSIEDVTEENLRDTPFPDEKLLEAYNIYSNQDGWHRDYIYYNISPSQDRGEFSYDYQEHITTFKLNGDPLTALVKIADQTGDPKLQVDGSTNPSVVGSYWTGGFFEFKVTTLINSKTIGTSLTSYFPAKPTELFSISFKRGGPLNAFYIPVFNYLKTMRVDLPVFAWDLNDYGASITIDIEEVDAVEEVQTTTKRSSEFATNFGIEGTLKKIGLKFGATNKETRSQDITRTVTLGNDILGSVIVNFADNVFVSRYFHPNFQWVYQTREYSTGWYTISVEPKKVQ